MLREREEYYIRLIGESESLIEVCRKAGIVPTTGNYDTLKKVITNNSVDISHFKRVGGTSTKKRELSEYLVKGVRVSSFKLKNRLLEEGIKEHKCENPECGMSEWHGKPIPLELHHINGDNTDNRLENLQILCPNCHALTDNYSGKNQKLNKRSKALTTIDKENILKVSEESNSIREVVKKTKHAERTVKKVLENAEKKINKNDRVKEENDKKVPLIIDSIKRTRSYTGTAREFGVTDNAIKKLLVKRGYPSKIKDLLESITG